MSHNPTVNLEFSNRLETEPLKQRRSCGSSTTGAIRRVFTSKSMVLGRSTSLLIVLFLGLTSCFVRTTYPVIKPISPVHKATTDYTQMPQVDSLQPTFRWELSKESPRHDTIYDLVIHEAALDRGYRKSPSWVSKRLVYRRDGLKETEHRVEIALEPSKHYIWSVRYHQGAKVSGWSACNGLLVSLIPIPGAAGAQNIKGLPFVFRTPRR